MQELEALNQRLIADIEGMPWNDNHITPNMLRESVKYFIAVYTREISELIGEKNA